MNNFIGDATERPVCVYDTDCGFCTKLAKWAEQRTDVEFTGYADLSHRGVDDAEFDKYLVYAGETVERGHGAVSAVLKTMKFPWNVIGRLIDFAPIRPASKKVYRSVAERRHCSMQP